MREIGIAFDSFYFEKDLCWHELGVVIRMADNDWLLIYEHILLI